MDRIALLHFTAAPHIGGVEQLIAAQIDVLSSLGCDVRLVVGEGDRPGNAELARLPELHPLHPAVVRALTERDGVAPRPDHPLVTRIRRRLGEALQGCDQCWIHNALTVYLNPFLTMALLSLIEEMPEVRWVAWCEDLSRGSAYWPRLAGDERARLQPPARGIEYVTISRARRGDLASFLGVPADEIRLVRPPLDFFDWIDASPATHDLVRRLDLGRADPLVFVPAKLLPHKNLQLAVRVVAELRQLTPCPVVVLSGAPSPHDAGGSTTLKTELLRLAHELGAADSFHLVSDELPGPPDRLTVRDLMLLADLVLLCSSEEGFGVPIQEALSLRAPLLCSDIPPFREAGGDVAEYFALDSSVEEVARQVVAMTGRPESRARRAVLGSAGRFRAEIERLLYLHSPLDHVE